MYLVYYGFRPAMKKDIKRLFSPKSIAVVGASKDASKVGGIVLSNLIDGGYKGKIYPVNPKKGYMRGLVVYESVTALPEVVDLAIVATPVSINAGIIDRIGEKAIKNVLVFTAGYKEAGEEGKRYEQELKLLVQKHELNLLGPNCLGYINTAAFVNATFGSGVKHQGNLLFVSQSGAIASSIFDWADATGVGILECITLGNKATLSEIEVMDYWQDNLKDKFKEDAESSRVYPIGMYLESIDDGEEFVNKAKKLSLNHPTFILKPGKSEASKKAMQSHTGAIAGADFVLNQAFLESGIIRCDGIEDFFDLSKAFSWEQAPKGPNMAIVSNAGGPAVMSSDSVEENGMKLAKLSKKTKSVLKKNLPRAASVLNPIDVLGDALAERYENAIRAVLSETEVDVVVVILTPQVMTEIEKTAKIVSELSKKYNKPILCSFMGGSQILVGEKYLHAHKIPSYRFPERAIWAAAKMWQWNKWRQDQKLVTLEKINPFKYDLLDEHSAEIILLGASSSGQHALDSHQAENLLKTADIITPPSAIVGSIDEAREFVNTNMFPVVIKLSSADLLHKKDVGGVMVGIETDEQLEEAYEKMVKIQKKLIIERKIEIDILIQSQVKSGVEMIVGVKKDVSFGSVLLFGAGGTLAELVADRNILLPPINKKKVKQALTESKIYPLLSGYRGEVKYDVDKLVDQMTHLFALGQEMEMISEIEINPLIINEDGVFAVDGKVVLNH
jgi:acetyltransferase